MLAKIVILSVVIAAALGWWFLTAEESVTLNDQAETVRESQPKEARRRRPAFQTDEIVASADDFKNVDKVPANELGKDDLEIFIVDHLQQPLINFPIALCPELNLLRKKGHDKCELRRTDGKGRVVIKEFHLALANSKDAPWYLVHDVQFEDLPHLRLDSNALKGNSDGIIKSVQPPFGSIEVRAIEADLTPSVDLWRAEISLIRPEESTDPTLVWSRKSWSAEFKTGRALFSYVQLNRKWSASVFRKGSQVPSSGEDSGPEYHGSHRVFSVTLGLDHPVALFRAVNEHNVPLVGTTLDVTLSRTYGGSSDMVVTTDANGRFRVDCKKKALFGGRFVKATYGKGKTRISGSAKISERMKDGANDCGDIILYADGPLVSGRAFDANGNPISSLQISAGESVSYTGTERSIFSSPNQFVRAKTDEDGFFSMRGAIPSEEFFVWADDNDVRSPGVKVKRGQSDVRLECYTVCIPDIIVLLGAGARWDGLKIQLRPTGSDEEGIGYTSASQSGDSIKAVLSPVDAGIYDLVWTYRGRPMGSILGLDITKSGTIATIDVREALHVFTINLESADGKPVSGAFGVIRWRPASSNLPWQTISITGAKTKLTTDVSSLDVQVWAAGYRHAAINGLTGSQTLTLQPAVRVRFVLKTDGKLPVHPYIFDPYPMVDGRSVGKPIGARYFTDKNREVTFLLSPGPIVVGWHMERREKGGAVGGTVLSSRNVKIEVVEGMSEQVFELKLAASALESLIRNPPF